MATQPTIAANAPVSSPNSALAMALQGYSPQTAQYDQQAQMMAQALQQMGQQGQNIRTPVALASDLLAQALLRRRYGQTMQDFVQSARADQGQMYGPNSPLMSVLGQIAGGGQQGAQSAPPASMPQAAPAPDASAPPPSPTPQNTAPAISPIVLRAVLGEAGGNADGQKAVYASILKRAQESGLSPEQVVTAPGQYEGLNAPWMAKVKDLSPYLAQTAANIASTGPGPADSFYSPRAQAALGRQAPTWAQGAPVASVGGNDFYQTGYQAPVGMTPSRAQTPGGQPSYAPQGQPGPAQIATGPTSTPTPSPSPSASPSAPGGPASAPPAALSPAGGASSPNFANRPYIDPERARFIQAEISSPMTRGQGLQDAHALAQEYMSGDQWDVKSDPATGQTTYTSKTRPGVSFAAATQGARPAPPAGYQWGDDGQAHPIPGVAVDAKQMMTSDGHGGYQAVSTPLTDAQAGQLKGIRSEFWSSPEHQEYVKAANGLNSLNLAIQRSTKNNGVLDQAAVDNLVQSETGLSARQGAVQMVLEHFGLPQEVAGKMANAVGNGFVTPQSLMAVRSMIRSYAEAHGKLAQNRLDQDDAFARSTTGRSLGMKLMPLAPDANPSWLGGPTPAPQRKPQAAARPGFSDASEFQ
jgi:hypothetical protein